MTGEDFGMRLLKRGELLIDGTRYEPMQLFAPALKERFIGRVPDQCVLERVIRFGRNPVNVD